MDENSGLLHWIFGDSRSEVFCKRGVFNNYANSSGKDLCGSVLDSGTGVFLSILRDF